jgi:signal transduction histidine kinase
MIRKYIFRNNRRVLLAILFSCMLVITFIVVLGIRANNEVQNIVQKQFTDQQLLLSRQMSTGIENFLNERTINIEILAKGLSDAPPDTIITAFKNVYNETNGIYVLEFVNKSGIVTIGYPEENTPFGYDIYKRGNPRNEPISQDFERAKNNKETYITNPMALLEGGQGSFIWAPVYKNGDFEGMVLAIIKIEDVSNRFLKNNDSPGIYLIDNDGIVLYDSSEKYLVGENYLTVLNDTNPLLRQILQEQINGAEGTGYYFEGNKSDKKLIAYSPIRWRDQSWSIAVTSPESEVGALIYSVYVKQGMFIGVAIGFILLGSLSIIILLSGWNKSLELEVAKKTSELKDSNELLQNANAKLTELDRLKSDFISLVSHELKTPLSAIRTSAEFLESEGNTDPKVQKEMLVNIIRNIDRQTHMINEILDLSKIEAGKMEFRFEEVDFHEIAGIALENIEQLALKKNITISRDIPDMLPSVFADREKLVIVLNNFLGNALKFTPDGGKILLSAREKDDGIEIRVKDTGIGIENDKLVKIFDKFYQVDCTSRRKTGGSGLGLSIAYGIVRAHGSEIYVESEPGKGSTFFFRLKKSGKQ